MLNQDINTEVKNKILLLYTYQTIQIPIDPDLVNQMLLDLSIMDYFEISHYTAELLEAGMLEGVSVENALHYMITENGRSALSLFKDRLSDYAVNKLDHGIAELRKSLKIKRVIQSNIVKLENETYMVNLSIAEGVYPMINLNLNVATNKKANLFRKNWQKNATDVYGKIITILGK